MTFSKFKKEALDFDENDPLRHFRERFHLPQNQIYLCNNSLGLPPKEVFMKMQDEIEKWQELGASGWFSEKANWFHYSDLFLKKPLAHLLGAYPEEVVVMNSLTINLHLLLFSFFQPTKERYKILIEAPTFASDLYAIQSHLERHQLPKDALIVLNPKKGELLLKTETIEEILEKEGEKIACVFLNGVNFLTGQVLEMEKIVTLCKKKGCVMGYDLAHASGNIILELHEWEVDFAVGCSYKYLCSGPGGPGFAFIHRKHHSKNFPRLSGWWGNDPKTRFEMPFDFIPYGGASSWQVSTPSILSRVPFASSLKIFEEAKMEKVRQKSILQTRFMIHLLEMLPFSFEIVTPKNSDFRGSQISLRFKERPQEILTYLKENHVIVDFRFPDIIRVTPHPLYNTYLEIFEFCFRLSKIPFSI